MKFKIKINQYCFILKITFALAFKLQKEVKLKKKIFFIKVTENEKFPITLC